MDGAFAGDAYWFANPNNHVTNNIASDMNGGAVYSYGFNVDASGNDAIAVGVVQIPAYQGADISQAGLWVLRPEPASGAAN